MCDDVSEHREDFLAVFDSRVLLAGGDFWSDCLDKYRYEIDLV
jgi:hypothetical protein